MSAISIASYFAFSRAKVMGQILIDNGIVYIKIEADFRHSDLKWAPCQEQFFL